MNLSPSLVRIAQVTLIASALACSAPRAAAGLEPGDLVAICGDSITEQRRYSVFMEDYLLMCQPQPGLQTVQFGWSGERAPQFLERMKNDVLPFKPTVATTCYGMNDGGYGPMKPEVAQNYTNAMSAIVKRFKDAGLRFIVVGGPGAVDTSTYKKTSSEVYNKTLGELNVIAQQIAEKNGVAFANVHDVMMDVMAKAKAKYGDAYHVAGRDGVHPDINGHLVMAYAFLKALGCSGDIGTITYDFKGGKAQATDGHKILSSGDGSMQVESSKYPFCFYGNPAETTSSQGVLEFLPFNQDLNRFQLVVKNAPGEKLKVTWGTASKEFSTADLAAGINLAAEFLDNPFSAPFAAVEKVIQQQQAFETPASKTMLHSLIDWQRSFPEENETYSRLVEKVVKKDVALRNASSAAVKPVTHTIKIEAVN